MSKVSLALNSLEPLAGSGTIPSSEILPCGRICDDHLREAHLIQSSLIPSRTLCHRSIEIAFRFTPFFHVGGDFVDFFPLPDGLLGLYVGDVVGKGLPATMYGALVMGALRGIHKTGNNTAAVLTILNERLLQRPIPGRFCSTLYAVVDPATGTLQFSNAGLPFPLHASTSTCQPLGQGGFPSGLMPSATYDHNIIQLSQGDVVLFATDGLYESRDPHGVEFSSARMCELWAQCCGKSAEESLAFLFAGLHAFSHGHPSHDDIAAVALKILP